MRRLIVGILKDQERAEKMARLKSLLDVFKYNPTPENRDAVVKAAKELDEVRGGSFRAKDYRTSYSDTIEEELDSIMWGP